MVIVTDIKQKKQEVFTARTDRKDQFRKSLTRSMNTYILLSLSILTRGKRNLPLLASWIIYWMPARLFRMNLTVKMVTPTLMLSILATIKRFLRLARNILRELSM